MSNLILVYILYMYKKPGVYIVCGISCSRATCDDIVNVQIVYEKMKYAVSRFSLIVTRFSTQTTFRQWLTLLLVV